MKISEKVLRYAEGEMTPSEKKEFEAGLENSQELKNELAEYLKLMNRVAEVKKINIDDGYYTSIVPQFRLKQPTGKKRFYPVYAAAAMTVIIIIIFIGYPGKNEVMKSNVQPVTASVDSSLIINPEKVAGEYSNYYDNTDTVIVGNEEYNAAIDKMLLDELKISEESLDSIYYSTYATYFQSVSDLSDEESQVVYDEMLNKRFF